MFNYGQGVNGRFRGLLSHISQPTKPLDPLPVQPVVPLKPKRVYLGEFPVDIRETEFANYTPKDWALYYFRCWGMCDGDSHKAWVMDQVARILNGTPVTVVERRWDDGTTVLDVDLGEPTAEYLEWVRQTNHGEDGPDTYEWDEGIPP